MPLRINTNLPALNAKRILKFTGRDLAMRIERLSSGLKINRAADDASGLSISEGIRAEVAGYTQGIRNAEQATNLIQTAEGALGEINSMLVRMRELAVQSASTTVNDNNRTAIQAEFSQLVTEIDRITRVTAYNNSTLLSGYGNVVNRDAGISTALASTTTGVVGIQVSGAAAGTYVFQDDVSENEIALGNGVVTQTIRTGTALDRDGAGSVVATGGAAVFSFDRLGIQISLSGQRNASGNNPALNGYRNGDLDGTAIQIDAGTGGTFQIGPNVGASHRLELNIADMRATGASLNLGGVSLASAPSAQSAISSIDQAIQQVLQSRGDLGAMQNRLGFGIRSSSVMLENNQATESSIRDADLAEEVSAFSRAQILTQSGLAVFSQANIQAAAALNLV